MNNAVIQTFGLTKTFHGVQALKGIDLIVPQNTIVGFLGPNGAGKSTTIKLLLGLTKPTSGQGHIFGMDIVKQNLEIRRKVGYLAQHPQFYKYMTPTEILRFTASFYFSGPKRKIEQRISEVLDIVDLSAKADREISGFSGGELQRLGIAQAQINYPDLLILDEPAAALDPLGRHAVLEIMENLKKETTIFFSTHILDDVQKVSDWVIILDQGTIQAQGPIENILGDDNETDIFTLETTGEKDWVEHYLDNSNYVKEFDFSNKKGTFMWRIKTNAGIHKNRVLLDELLVNKEMDIIQFSKSKLELEDVFIKLVKEGS